ncbi:hypothetical protein MUO71_03015 [Candidatus Bathyarchaeota archaeon]|nr:hypothetical protein [Candidatus Bathyarchaeota archaeon]
MITTPLRGTINKTDTQNLQEMLKGLGPIATLFTLPLCLIEKITSIFQKA